MTSPSSSRSRSRAATALLTFGLLSAACRSSSSNGGAAGAGGSGGMAALCTSAAPCGGDVVGDWTVTSSCLTVTGKLDLSVALGSSCPSPSVTGSLQVSGTWSAKADGTYADNTTTSGSEQFALAPACLTFSGTTVTCDQASTLLQALGYSSVACTTVAGGGCSCSANVEQLGTAGFVTNDPRANGDFTIANGTVAVDTSNSYAYCVSGSKMTWIPQTQSPTTTGTIVFQRGGSAGTGGGGGGGAAGDRGSGGSTGAGGATGLGGMTGVAGATGSGGGSAAGGASGAFSGPCDIYGSSGTPCVAAYSTVRVLSSKYSGPLYEIRIGGSSSGTGGTLKDIGRIQGNVFADGAAQDAACGSAACTISKLYDQSGKGNDLTVAGPGCYVTTADTESNATGRSLTISGHKVYALYMVSNSSFGSSNGPIHDGYRNNSAVGTPMGTAAQGQYEVVDGKRANAGCCWDFGTAQRDSCSTGGTGAMNTVSFGTKFVWGTGAGNGPWFLADFEGGVWAGGSGVAATTNANNPSVTWDYAFGLVKTDTANNMPRYAIRVGNAQSGGLMTAYDGQAPGTAWNLQGGVVLGIGGDNSNTSYGTFFEGAITAGRPSDATDLAVLQNAQAAGYGK